MKNPVDGIYVDIVDIAVEHMHLMLFYTLGCACKILCVCYNYIVCAKKGPITPHLYF